MHPSPSRRHSLGRTFHHPLSRYRPTCPPCCRTQGARGGSSGHRPCHCGAHAELVKGQVSELARGELSVWTELWAQVEAPSSLSSDWDPESDMSLIWSSTSHL